MILVEADHFQLSTGRTFYAHGGIVGLSPDSNAVTEGYDGPIECHLDDLFPPDNPWTDAERAELADFMIALWTAWKVQNAHT